MIYLNDEDLYMDGTENEDFIIKLAEEIIGKEVYPGLMPHLTPICDQVIYFKIEKKYGIAEVYGIHHIPEDEEFYTGVIYYKDENGDEFSQTVDRIRDKSKLWVAQ